MPDASGLRIEAVVSFGSLCAAVVAIWKVATQYGKHTERHEDHERRIRELEGNDYVPRPEIERAFQSIERQLDMVLQFLRRGS